MKTNNEKECTLSDEELAEACRKLVHDLCQTGGQRWRMSVPVDFNSDSDMLFCELINRFKEASQFKQSSPEGEGWISVKDRLPDDISCVLIWRNISLRPDYAYYCCGDWLFCTVDERYWNKEEPTIKVTHWMPLPSPPKSEQPQEGEKESVSQSKN